MTIMIMLGLMNHLLACVVDLSQNRLKYLNQYHMIISDNDDNDDDDDRHVDNEIMISMIVIMYSAFVPAVCAW